ncbi:MAG TPA: UDP-N-acetylglucosamine 2-epimerase (non-hydrolyzing), partial [Anaerolineales bacterium]|nr:UDP-N-acetylglucosamine 2-epimerase (non-hydrolyzing) [Anaerolineales bacterium]
MKILSVVGTRPEAVKMAPVVRALKLHPEIDSRLCVTAQHRDMMDQVLRLFELEPDYDLDLMREDQGLPELSAAIFSGLNPVMEEYQPDWVLVQGDTTTVAITALLTYYRHLRLGHIEAGLRTHNKWQPFPEEINRRVAGVAADLHFAPTEQARLNLLREGVDSAFVLVTGNPVIDALLYVAAQPEPDLVRSLMQQVNLPTYVARGSLASSGRALCLVTAHRRESFGAPLEHICEALRDLAARGDVEILYPVHPNPNVHDAVYRLLHGVPHVTLLPPLDYLPLVHLMKRSRLILTDSGGIQEEAPAFGVPVLVLREVTERPEGVEAGTLKLVGTDRARIVAEATRLLDDEQAYTSMSK